MQEVCHGFHDVIHKWGSPGVGIRQIDGCRCGGWHCEVSEKQVCKGGLETSPEDDAAGLGVMNEVQETISMLSELNGCLACEGIGGKMRDCQLRHQGGGSL